MTMSKIIIYIGAALSAIWGIAHLIPTKNVVAGFGGISDDNRNIITMEWIVEGVALIFIGALVALVTYADMSNPISKLVYGVSACALLSLAIVAFFTGYKVKFLPFKMCPFVLALSAAFITVGGMT